MATLFSIHTDAWRFAHPVGQYTVEQFNVGLTHIMAHPLVEDGAQEATPLLGRNREVGQRCLITISEGGQMSAILMINDTLNDRRY